MKENSGIDNSTHAENLKRVKSSIGTHVIDFLRERLHEGNCRFFMSDLHKYIIGKASAAPASPDRVLRQLKLDGECGYLLISRSNSEYEITFVKGSAACQKT